MASAKDRPRGIRGPARFQQGPITTALQLGPLAPLIGSWIGKGLNTIWRPDNTQSPEDSAIRRFLELNLTNETFHFEVIPGVVPNRGVANQADLNLYGLHYLQRVSERESEDGLPATPKAGSALHIEPGLFMNVPASLVNPDNPLVNPDGSPAPENPASIVRMASIPHGVSLLMQGPVPPAAPTAGPPKIPSIYPISGLPVIDPSAGALGLGIQPIDIPSPGGDGGTRGPGG
jgi:hypothetical protein